MRKTPLWGCRTTFQSGCTWQVRPEWEQVLLFLQYSVVTLPSYILFENQSPNHSIRSTQTSSPLGNYMLNFRQGSLGNVESNGLSCNFGVIGPFAIIGKVGVANVILRNVINYRWGVIQPRNTTQKLISPNSSSFCFLHFPLLEFSNKVSENR